MTKTTARTISLKKSIPDFTLIKRFPVQLGGVVLFMMLLAACSPRIAEFQPIGEFESSRASAEEVMSTLVLDFEQVDALTGRANARISSPDYSDQATLLFTSDRVQSLLAMRNNLGIEGGRIYADADSVTMYDRIESKAWKMSTEDSYRILLNGLTAFNLLEFLLPAFTPGDVSAVFESEDKWMLGLYNGNQLYFNKSSGLLTRIFQPAEHPEAYNQFIFSNHARLEGLELPRRIQILSNDEKSSIFLLIQALELNPSAPSFDIGIPDDIPITRI